MRRATCAPPCKVLSARSMFGLRCAGRTGQCLGLPYGTRYAMRIAGLLQTADDTNRCAICCAFNPTDALHQVPLKPPVSKASSIS